MNLYFSRTTLKGQFTPELSPIVIKVPNTFFMSKYIDKVVGQEHAKDSEGNLLYFKDIYKEIPYMHFLHDDETTEVTDRPLMEKYQKENEDGEKLYLEVIENEEGEEETFETTKEFNEQGEPNMPIILERQKTTLSGKPIYLIAVYEERIRYEYEGTEITTEYTDTPVIADIKEPELVNIIDHPQFFTANEVIERKVQDELEKSKHDYIIYDAFLDDTSIDKANSLCSSGVALLSIPPSGHVNFNSIELIAPASAFTLHTSLPEGVKMYLNTKLVSDGEVVLAKPYSNIKIKLVNTTEAPVTIPYIAIFYNKEDVVECYN